MLDQNRPFSEKFNLLEDDLTSLVIRETVDKSNCYIYNGDSIIGGFILVEKPGVKTIVNVTFYKSSAEGKYLPRLEFRKVDNDNVPKISRGNDVIIKFGDGDDAKSFWKVIEFLHGFKDLVDVGDFQSKYQAISFDNYLLEFKSKQPDDRITELISLVENAKLSNNDIKELIRSQRKNKIHWFYAFLKNSINEKGVNVYNSYRNKHEITEPGDEAIWHHFLKNNEWIIGLNVDIKFIRDLLSEQSVGTENSKRTGSPTADFIGISYFTSIIELKRSDTKIFKQSKTNKSRTNTWDFSNDFIEAYSQVLAQRTSLTENKEILDEDNIVVDNQLHRILDPKAILLIGNRNEEFPHNRSNEYNLKTDSFERFRRDSRNIEILTFDELFERAFHIVFTEKLPKDWYSLGQHEFKQDVLGVI